MIPSLGNTIHFEFITEEQPTQTYQLDFERGRIYSKCDGLEAMKQAIYKILMTERYEYLIYSWNYGVEFLDLIGVNASNAYASISRRISEALLQDKRIKTVDSFEYVRPSKSKVMVSFVVTTDLGAIEVNQEVSI